MKLFRSLLGSFHNVALIFDKDGTLIDTETLYFEVFDRLVGQYGCHHDLRTHADMMGASADTCLDILRKRHPGFPQNLHVHKFLRDDLTRHIINVRRERGTQAMAGASELLEFCRTECIRVGMATSASRENTEMDLRNLGWNSYFETVVTASDVSRHKPAPDIYLEAAKRMGIEPGACIAFEDGVRGVQSAHAAGMRVVFVRDERFGVDAPSEVSLTVGSLMEFLR